MDLHAEKDAFTDIISGAARYFNISEIYIEKDYWVTLLLYRLSQYEKKDRLIFKGGTALAKASRIINRFSEDIDLAVLMPEANGNQIKTFMRHAETAITTDLIALPGYSGESKGSVFRKTYYRYPQEFQGDFAQASQVILLEINAFNKPEPVYPLPVCALITDFLKIHDQQLLIDKYHLDRFILFTLGIERTLTEKLVALIKAARSPDALMQLTIKIRHFYDICMILRHADYSIPLYDLTLLPLLQSVVDADRQQFTNAGNWFNEPLDTIPLFCQPEKYWPALNSAFRQSFALMVFDNELPDDKEVIAALNAIQRLLTHYQLQAGMRQA